MSREHKFRRYDRTILEELLVKAENHLLMASSELKAIRKALSYPSPSSVCHSVIERNSILSDGNSRLVPRTLLGKHANKKKVTLK